MTSHGLATITVALLVMALAACGTAGTSSVTPSMTGDVGTTEAPSPTSPAVAQGVTCPDEPPAGGGTCQIVLGVANIFGAGHDVAPAPGEGGPGQLPPMWSIPEGATAVAVEEVEGGSVKPVPAGAGNGAAGVGDIGNATNISSYGGISGILDKQNAMFLVGVFLTDEEPQQGQHPDRLGFTDNEDFTELAPLIAQTFFVGDGEGKTFVVPEGATRLFLGFADAYDVTGDPGWYGNNSGQLAVIVTFDTD